MADPGWQGCLRPSAEAGCLPSQENKLLVGVGFLKRRMTEPPAWAALGSASPPAFPSARVVCARKRGAQ